MSDIDRQRHGMDKPREISLAWLAGHQACDTLKAHCGIFEAAFGDRIAVTRENLVRAARAGLYPHWLAERLLGGDALERFHGAARDARAAWLAADAATPEGRARLQALTDASDALQRAIEPHLEGHYARLASATCEADIDASLAIYRPATDHHYDEHRRACESVQTEPRRRMDAALAILHANALADVLGLS
jgi:hypothetical protein